MFQGIVLQKIYSTFERPSICTHAQIFSVTSEPLQGYLRCDARLRTWDPQVIARSTLWCT